MINLEEYGFVKMEETERQTDYDGYDFKVIIYNYMVTTSDKSEIAHNTFLVSSKQFTSRSRPISELAAWLVEKNIKKIK